MGTVRKETTKLDEFDRLFGVRRIVATGRGEPASWVLRFELFPVVLHACMQALVRVVKMTVSSILSESFTWSLGAD